jgi:hypothetical protein
MTASHVERLVRSVITECDLPISVLAVADRSGEWQIMAQEPSGRFVRVTVEDGPPKTLRNAIREVLEAQIN